MLTALPSLPAPLDQEPLVLCFDRNSLIPDILKSIKLIFLSNGCQGTRISCLFFEKKKFSIWKDHFRTSAKRESTHLFERPFWKSAFFCRFCGLLAALYKIQINTYSAGIVINLHFLKAGKQLYWNILILEYNYNAIYMTDMQIK